MKLINAGAGGGGDISCAETSIYAQNGGVDEWTRQEELFKWSIARTGGICT